MLTHVALSAGSAAAHDDVILPSLPLLPPSLKLDFAPSPQQLQGRKHGPARILPKRAPSQGTGLSPRLELGLSVKCVVEQERKR
jgi:hypothetical protein